MSSRDIRKYPKEIQDYIRSQLANSAANMESGSRIRASKKNAGEKNAQKYHVHVHSKRKRLADPDNLCSKWAVDTIVEHGILPGDTCEYISAVTFTQEKAKENETTIRIYQDGCNEN